jgi:hypothetical protein
MPRGTQTATMPPGTPLSPRRKVRRRRATNTVRSGAAAGITPVLPIGNDHAMYDDVAFAANIKGQVTGFALARGITTNQAWASLKKHLGTAL